jgi:iron complex outermembrane receptor protein
MLPVSISAASIVKYLFAYPRTSTIAKASGHSLAQIIHCLLMGGTAFAPLAATASESTPPTAATTTTAAPATEQMQQLDTVKVSSSYSRSLEKAVDMKRENLGFSDSLVATDVADFPEQNLSEALQRMPGVTIERNKGLGSKVNVRGLPSEYTHVSINNLATASGSGERDVEFDIFASEIVQQVTVQKSPTAADEEGGIAGSVLISTARPFDYSERKLVASTEAAWNSISAKTDPRFSFLASDTWGPWGALASFSRSQRRNRTDATSGINFRPMSRFLGASGSRGTQAQEVLQRDAGVTIADRSDTDETNRIVFPDKVSDSVSYNDQDKWGATLSLQYKPDNHFNVSFDAMVGGYDTNEDEYAAAAYSASSRSTLDSIHEYDDSTLSQDGIVVVRDATYTATQHEILSKQRINNTDYQQYSLSMDWNGDGWKIDGLLGYSGAEKLKDYANLKHVAYAPSRTRWSGRSGETIPSDDADTIDMYASPQRYQFESYETTREKISDDKYAAQLNFSRALDLAFFPALRQVQFGVRHTDKSKQRQYGEAEINGPGADDDSWVGTRTLADSELQWVSDVVPGGAYSTKNLNWQTVSNDYARKTFRYAGYSTPYDDGQYYRVEEKTTSAYAMADLDVDLGSIPVHINTGVRHVDTTVTSEGYHQIQMSNGTTGYTDSPVSKQGSYQKYLPSINLTAELADNLLLRAAAAKTMMRPALSDIAYKRTASWSSYRYTDGNPDLQPTYSKQWEIGLEKYLDNGGLLAASYFRKTIDGVVVNSWTGVVKDVAVYNANGTLNGTYDFDVYQPTNAEDSYQVDGFELAVQFPLRVLFSALDGFGINANYTRLDSSLAGESSLGIKTPMPGLAENSYNFTLYYENSRFDARLAYNYKSKYVESLGYDMYPIWRDDYGQLDASIGYRLGDRFKLSLDAINLTNKAASGYTMDPSLRPAGGGAASAAPPPAQRAIHTNVARRPLRRSRRCEKKCCGSLMVQRSPP